MGVALPLCVVVTIQECRVTFSGVKLSIRSFVLFSQATVYTVIYKHNFVDRALIVAFSVSTVIITEY